MNRKVYYFSITCPQKEGKKGRGHPSDHACDMDCHWLDFDRTTGEYVCGWPRPGHVLNGARENAPEEHGVRPAEDVVLAGIDDSDVMQCPECDYHTRPAGHGRLLRVVRTTLTKHLIHAHGYTHAQAVAKLEELGYAVEGTDISEFMVQFEAMVGGSL